MLWLHLEPKNSCAGLHHCTLNLYSVSQNSRWYTQCFPPGWSPTFGVCSHCNNPQPGHWSAWIVPRGNHIPGIPQRKGKLATRICLLVNEKRQVSHQSLWLFSGGIFSVPLICFVLFCLFVYLFSNPQLLFKCLSTLPFNPPKIVGATMPLAAVFAYLLLEESLLLCFQPGFFVAHHSCNGSSKWAASPWSYDFAGLYHITPVLGWRTQDDIVMEDI